MPELPPRAIAWAQTMAGHAGGGVVRAHAAPGVRLEVPQAVLREQREERPRRDRFGGGRGFGGGGNW